MDTIFLIGRIIVGLYFLFAGYNHFKNLGFMSGYVASKGIPAPKLAVAGTGVLLLAGGASVLLGLYPRAGIALLVLFLLGVSFTMHAFWKIPDPQQRMGEQVNFLKNIALLGALLMFLTIPTPWPTSLSL
jgi:putative oxidoreductase